MKIWAGPDGARTGSGFACAGDYAYRDGKKLGVLGVLGYPKPTK